MESNVLTDNVIKILVNVYVMMGILEPAANLIQILVKVKHAQAKVFV